MTFSPYDVTDIEAIKPELKQRLNDPNFLVTVEFRKADDSLRVINGTTAMELISRYIPEPEPDTEAPKIEKKKNDEIQVIFDLDKKEWRSFRWDRVVSWFSAPLKEKIFS